MQKQLSVTPESISDHFKSYYKIQKPLANDTFDKHLYFLTARFQITHHGNLARSQLDEFGKLYFRLAQQLLGNNLNRKRRQHPLCYAFVDAEGSRSGTSDIFNCEMPHVHAAILIPSKFHDKFESAFSAARLDFLFPLKSIHIDRFCPAKGSVENLISYCMKGYRQATRSHFQRDDLWAVFPR